MVELCEYIDDLDRCDVTNKHLVSEKYLRKYLNKGFYSILKVFGVSVNHLYVIKDIASNEIIAAGCIRYKISKWSKSKSAWLYGIVVDENIRGRGYGDMLLNELLRKIEKKYRYVYLFVDSDNDIAVNLYKKNGFVPVGREACQIVMRKNVC